MPQYRKFRCRRAANIVASLLVFLAVVGLAAILYRVHLFWKYTEYRLDLYNTKAIPNKTMPETPTPEEWIRTRVGCIELSLPPDLAKNIKISKKGGSYVAFQYGRRAVFVFSSEESEEADERAKFLKAASSLSPGKEKFTLPRLKLTCFQAKPKDFRWSMTPAEVRWHAFRMTIGSIMRGPADGHTETLFRKDLDGIIHFFREDRNTFEWQCVDSPCHGQIEFTDRDKMSDGAWIRAVCQSIKRIEPSAKAP